MYAAGSPTRLGSGMSRRAQYYRRQADICMRLSLLSDDDDVAELLINKAMELMSQAETAEAEGDRNDDSLVEAIGEGDRNQSPGDLDNSPH